jgi:hypothetical protein
MLNTSRQATTRERYRVGETGWASFTVDFDTYNGQFGLWTQTGGNLKAISGRMDRYRRRILTYDASVWLWVVRPRGHYGDGNGGKLNVWTMGNAPGVGTPVPGRQNVTSLKITGVSLVSSVVTIATTTQTTQVSSRDMLVVAFSVQRSESYPTFSFGEITHAMALTETYYPGTPTNRVYDVLIIRF